MKYFKYKKLNKIKIKADKEYLASLDKDEKKKVIKSRIMQKFLTITAAVVFFSLFLFSIYLIKQIPVPAHALLSILYGLGCGFLVLIALIISALITFLLFGRLIEKIDYELPKMKKEYISNACEDIRNYYGLGKEYLITKCFVSTNEKFNNHDICIFRYGNEIRITTDLINGFINASCELGCYSINLKELKIYKDDYNNKRVTILEFGKEKFLIGIKAYSYIRKLMCIKIYKYFSCSIEMNEESIYFRKRKKVKQLKFSNIEKMELSIPKYTGIPGSGYSYNYTFRTFDFNKNMVSLSIVLERSEEQEILAILKDKNINLTVEYYDNKNEGFD